jgi:hypothetical protein
MKYLKKYNQFLLEAVLNIDETLIDKLKSYLKRNDTPESWKKISSLILSFIGKDSKKNRFDQINLDYDNKKNLLVHSGKQKNSQSISKIIRSILKSYDVDFDKHEIKDDTIQKFSDDLIGKIQFSKIETDSSGEIKIVSGNDIKYWYNSENTEKEDRTELFNSCMKGKMDKLDIYSNNDNIKLLIKLNSSGKLVARALLWKLDYSAKGYDWFLDRVYFNESSDKSLLFNWIKSQSGYEKINRKVESFEIIQDVMIVNLENVLFDSYPYIDTFNLYIDKKEDKFINKGFLSNISIFDNSSTSQWSGYDELEKRINDHVEFICKSTVGTVKSTDGEVILGEIQGFKLIKGFSDKIKKELLPIDEPLNELKNRIKIINTLYDTNDINSVFELVDINSQDMGNGLRKLNMGDNFYINNDFKTEKDINGYESDSSFKGMRFIVYDITDLLKDKRINNISKQITPNGLNVGGKTYMTELDCMIIGIYDKVKDGEKYFAEEYEIRQSVNLEGDKSLNYVEITEFLKKEMNLTDGDELIKLRKMVLDR